MAEIAETKCPTAQTRSEEKAPSARGCLLQADDPQTCFVPRKDWTVGSEPVTGEVFVARHGSPWNKHAEHPAQRFPSVAVDEPWRR
jgi:hypothetical protein